MGRWMRVGSQALPYACHLSPTDVSVSVHLFLFHFWGDLLFTLLIRFVCVANMLLLCTQVNVSMPIHPSLRRAYETLEPLFLKHIITEEVGRIDTCTLSIIGTFIRRA